jgi:mannan endo-1,4-beta-mannosidase
MSSKHRSRREVLAMGALFGAAPFLVASVKPLLTTPTLRETAVLGISMPLATLAASERTLGYKFGIVGGVYYSFDSNWAKHTRDLLPAAGRTLMVSWMPQVANGRLVLSDIPRGKYDAHIDQMLRGMRAFKGPVVCRLGHEPNGNWYPWSVACNSTGCSVPANYVGAWRYIVNRERRMAGASNIKWFWCANATDMPSTNGGKRYAMEQYWPGDAWVDIVGCDAFVEPTAWEPFESALRKPYDRISRLSKKPFWVGEVGCHEPLRGQHGTKAAWFEAMLNSSAFPNMRAICYFDYDARDRGRADWRLSSSSATLAGVTQCLRGVPRRV